MRSFSLPSSCANCTFEFDQESRQVHKYCHYIKKSKVNLFDMDMIHSSQYVTDIKPIQDNSFFVLHQNMRSMKKNFKRLESLIHTLKLKGSIVPTVIGVSETWLQSKVESNLEIFRLSDYIFVHEPRKQGLRGGAGLYIHKSVKFEELNISLSQAETKWIEINLEKNKKVIIGVIYAAEKNRNLNRFVEELDEILENFNHRNKKVIIMGDMNIDLFKINTRDKYYQTLVSNGYKSMISFATRITSDSETLIDHVLTNMTDLNCKPTGGTFIDDISDHCATFARFPTLLKISQPENKQKKVFCFKHYKRDAAFHSLSLENWAAVYNKTNVNEAYNTFQDILIREQSRVIPLVERGENEVFHQPWMTDGIRKAQKQRYKLYKKSKAKPNNTELKIKYTQYRNRLCKIIKNTEKQYYNRLIYQAEGNQAKTWQVLNQIMGRKKVKKELPDKLVLENGTEVKDIKSKVNMLNSFFVNVGEDLARKIPPNERSHDSYLSDVNILNSFFLNPATEQEVYNTLSRIKTKKSCGPDNLHPAYIKDMTQLITAPLTFIINQSIETSEVPDMMKIAKVLPLFKAGNKHNPTNYRPISLLPVLSKVLEGLIYKRLFKYFSDKNLFTDDQYGFRKGRSTKGALIRFINQVQQDVDIGLKTAAIYIDLKKAFDTVDHSILLNKLSIYGVRGNTLNWFANYLKNRRQFIEADNEKSCIAYLKRGVPQGSNLGPLLFIIYINDLPKSLNHATATLFADDTTISCTSQTMNSLFDNLNNDLEQLNEWFKANKLTLNTSKTYGCIFGHDEQSLSRLTTRLKIDRKEIEITNCVKYLGINVDAKLTWIPHITSVVNKISQTLGAVGKIKHLLGKKSLTDIYYSLIHSRISYCLEVWGVATNTALRPLNIAQKKKYATDCRSTIQSTY